MGTALLLGTVVSQVLLPALAVAALLFLGFTGLALYSAVTGRTIACSCFGASTTPLGWAHVGRNVALTGLAVFGATVSGQVTGSGHGVSVPLGHAASAWDPCKRFDCNAPASVSVQQCPKELDWCVVPE